MFMRSIRTNTKWVMMVMAVAFAAWLVLDWVRQKDQAATLGVNPIVVFVNGQEIRNTRWSEAYSVAIDRARALSGQSLNDEEIRQIESSAWEGMPIIRSIRISSEIRRSTSSCCSRSRRITGRHSREHGSPSRSPAERR